MKRTITGILVILTVITIFCLVACGVSNTITTTEATVTEIINGQVILTDVNGEMWVWEGAEHFRENDRVVIEFNTFGNDNLYDDVIINIRGLN